MDLSDIVRLYLRPVAEASGIFFIALGVIWFIDLLWELQRRGGWKISSFFSKPEGGFGFKPLRRFFKILSMIVCATGIIFIVVGVLGLVLDVAPRNGFIILIVLGILTHFKPLNDIPIATIVGLLAATIVGLVMVGIVYAANVYFGLQISRTMIIIMIVVLLVVFAIVALLVKLWLAPLELVSNIVSLPGLTLAISIYCIVLGYLIIQWHGF